MVCVCAIPRELSKMFENFRVSHTYSAHLGSPTRAHIYKYRHKTISIKIFNCMHILLVAAMQYSATITFYVGRFSLNDFSPLRLSRNDFSEKSWLLARLYGLCFHAQIIEMRRLITRSRIGCIVVV